MRRCSRQVRPARAAGAFWQNWRAMLISSCSTTCALAAPAPSAQTLSGALEQACVALEISKALIGRSSGQETGAQLAHSLSQSSTLYSPVQPSKPLSSREEYL